MPPPDPAHAIYSPKPASLVEPNDGDALVYNGATFQWEPTVPGGGGAPAGDGPAEVVAGAFVNPAVYGNPRTFRRVDVAGTALESIEQVPYIVDAVRLNPAEAPTYWSYAIPMVGACWVKATLLAANDMSNYVGVFVVQIVVKRAFHENITIVSGPNVLGPDELPAELAGVTATFDVDVGTQSVLLNLVNGSLMAVNFRGLIEVMPLDTTPPA